MEKLRCGVVLTDAFLSFLKAEATREAADIEKPTAIIEYVKCAEGLRAGEAWWKLTWAKSVGREDWCLFPLAAGFQIYLAPQTQKALKWKHIDYREGRVCVPD